MQITTKCNFLCAHCCYSCDMNGKHGDTKVIMDAIYFAAEYDGGEFISIGGGEPTLHPDFFAILKHCLWNFEGVWMATNGSQIERMFRLINIIDGEDYPECDCEEVHGQDIFDNYGCLCHEKLDYDSIKAEGKLSVAVSQDQYHDPIDPRIVAYWQRMSWELRDSGSSSQGLSGTGRAEENGLGSSDYCCCPDLLIQPDGKIRLCGCPDAPIIGDIYNGISLSWEKLMAEDDDYNDNRCYKFISKEVSFDV